jgi:hypothetical protein
MRIRLHDGRLLADLLSFMREAGCIAFQSDPETIEVLRPTRGDADAREIAALLAHWQTGHPGVDPEIV